MSEERTSEDLSQDGDFIDVIFCIYFCAVNGFGEDVDPFSASDQPDPSFLACVAKECID